MTTAIIDLNKTNGKWEARVNGNVIMSSGRKEYITWCIEQGRNATAKRMGVITWKDISEYDAEMRAAIIANNEEVIAEVEAQEEQVTFGINERFEFVADFVEMVGNRKNASAMIVGTGGLGKSHTTFETLTKRCGLRQIDPTSKVYEKPEAVMDEDGDYDLQANRDAVKALLGEQVDTFLVVKGYTTAKGLYRTLYENRNRVIVFDDCDAALKNEVSANLLKAALDSYDRRVITWNAEAGFGDDLPRSFEFFGGIVFISNMNMSQIPQALVSRSLVADVSMTRKEAIERMRVIVANLEFMPEYSNEEKEYALDFMETQIKRKEVADPNMRTLMTVIKILAKGDEGCERRALYTMCSAR